MAQAKTKTNTKTKALAKYRNSYRNKSRKKEIEEVRKTEPIWQDDVLAIATGKWRGSHPPGGSLP